MNNKTVLLTGITGFLGAHTAIRLLNKGYKVVGTLRDQHRIPSIQQVIEKHTVNSGNLNFAVADLNDSNAWIQLAKNADYIQHIASPFPRTLPRHEDDLVVPAREGTLNILKAAAGSKVKRVVLVSSLAAVVYGKSKSELNRLFTENDWTDEADKKDTTPYIRSKAIAEKAAWEFMKEDHSGLELTTVLPGAILGPVLENDFGTSANIVIKILDGSTPALPKIGFDIVDVRSVADLLISAMETPHAAGQRYIASAGYLTFKEIAGVLQQHYPGKKLPASELPDFAIKLFSNFDSALKPILKDLGIKRKTDISKAEKELQWQPLPPREAVIACAESVFENGIVKWKN